MSGAPFPAMVTNRRSAHAGSGRSVWNSRRAVLFGWQLAGLALGAALTLALRAELPPLDTWRIFTDTLLWSGGAALGAAVLLDALVGRQPYLHFTVALVSVVAAFGVLFVLVVGTHATYSRWAIVIGVAYTLAVQLHAWRRWRRQTSMRLAVVDDALMARLGPTSEFAADAAALDRCDWVVLAEGAVPLGVDGVVLPDDASAKYRQGVSLRAKLAGTQVYSETFVRSLLTGRLDIDRADTVFIDDVPGSWVYAAVKRGLDVAGALLLGVFALPVTLVAMALIRLESPGEALLVQPRKGLRGQLFGMYKLRTMREEASGPDALRQSSEARITRIGAWLRRSRFDELPQLLNVLRGEMSLIGPRPEWIETALALERAIPEFAFRYLVRPGITGWAQVHQGHVTAADAARVKLEYDLYYAKNMSLALDLAIGAMHDPHGGDGARRAMIGADGRAAQGVRVVAVVVAYRPDVEVFRCVLTATAAQVEAIVVVDNGRGAGLETIDWTDRLTRIDMHGNAGIAAAQNAGMRHAFASGASHVLLLDHDSVPGPGMTARLLASSQRLGLADAHVAAVGADYDDARHDAPSPFVRMGWFGYRRIAALPGAVSVPVSFLISSGSLVGIDAYEAVGAMDERLFIDYVDIEWCLRAARRGWHSYGVPGAMLQHRLGDEPLAWRRDGRSLRWFGRTLPSRSPHRHYYLFRNACWLMLRSALPLRWKLLEAKRLLLSIGAFGLFATRRREQLAAMLGGAIDGLRGRMGGAEAGRASPS